MCKTSEFVKNARKIINEIDDIKNVEDSAIRDLALDQEVLKAKELIKGCTNPTLPTLDKLIDKCSETGYIDSKTLRSMIGVEERVF